MRTELGLAGPQLHAPRQVPGSVDSGEDRGLRLPGNTLHRSRRDTDERISGSTRRKQDGSTFQASQEKHLLDQTAVTAAGGVRWERGSLCRPGAGSSSASPKAARVADRPLLANSWRRVGEASLVPWRPCHI